MDNPQRSIEPFRPPSQFPEPASVQLPHGTESMNVDQLLRDLNRDSNEGMTLDEFLTVAGTGEDNGDAGTGEVRRRKRGSGEMNGVDFPTQKEKRILKNRESAARSRERKQAYTMELELLVANLEEENSRLLNQQKESGQSRLKQLLENIVPITEKKKPQSSLRRTVSLEW